MDLTVKRLRRVGLAAFLVGVLAGAVPAHAAPKRVAVLDFQASWSGTCGGQKALRGDDAERCEILGLLTDEARSGALEVLRPPAYVVMTRENTAQLLKEMGGGQACTEGECEVETAKQVGADLVISGQVSAVEGQWLASVKLHDVRTAALLATGRARGRAKLDVLDALKREVELMVRKVAGARAPAAGVAEGAIDSSAATSFGAEVEEHVVGFESEPPGAVVLVDGQLLCSATPCRKRVAAGSHEASFQKERHSAASQAFSAAKGAVVKGALAPQFGWVSVETTPPGLSVAIGGTEVGKSPVGWKEQDPGGVEVVVSDRCWLRTGERVAVEAGKRRTVKIEGKARMAGLKVNAEDEKGNALEGMVKVDGVEVGPVGATLSVPLCSRRVEVPLGKETFATDLKLEEGKVASVTARPGGRALAGDPANGAASRASSGGGSRKDLDGSARDVETYRKLVKASPGAPQAFEEEPTVSDKIITLERGSSNSAPRGGAKRSPASCKDTGDCQPPILVDHFDSLSEWKIRTRSTTFPRGWEISPRGSSGSGAHNRTGGAGYGAEMSRTVNLASAAVCDLMIYKPSLGGPNFTQVTFSIDGVRAWSSGSSDTVLAWTRKSAEVPAGVHTIKIATDLAGEVLVDELECHPRRD